MSKYKGAKAREYWTSDFVGKYLMKAFFAPDAEKPALLKAIYEDSFPAAMKLLTEKCLGDSKFLGGDSLTIHDFGVAGFFVNVVLNPRTRMVGIADVYNA